MFYIIITDKHIPKTILDFFAFDLEKKTFSFFFIESVFRISRHKITIWSFL